MRIARVSTTRSKPRRTPGIGLTASTSKQPRQARSRARVTRILDVSSKLIRRAGLARLTMSSIARAAKIPIGSLYQYFPSKSALVHRLFQERLAKFNQMALKRLGPVRTRVESAAAVRKLVREIYRGNREDAVMQEIWAGVQADRDIRHIHLQDNEFYTSLFAQMAGRVGVRLRGRQLVNRVRVVNEMWDGVIRLIILRPKAEAKELLDDSLDVGLRAIGLER